MTKKKTHALSILLLKDHITCFDDAVKDPQNASLSISLDGCAAKLFYKSTPTQPPTWTRLFAPVATTELSELKNAGAAAVLLIKTQTNYFAITFGYGKSLLQPDCFEENFGLKEKWSGLFEQIFLIYKWKTCGFTLPLGPLTATR